MPPSTTLKESVKLSQTGQTLIDQITNFDDKALICKAREAVLRFEIDIEAVDSLAWLQQQTHPLKLFWADREGEMQIAGVGAAHTLSGNHPINYQFIFAEIQRRLSAHQENLRYFGGTCFDPRNYDSQWADFGTYYFFIPRFEILKQQNRFIFACNIIREDFQGSRLPKILEEIKTLVFSFKPRMTAQIHVEKNKNYPNAKQWLPIIAHELKKIKEKSYMKVVLARKSVFQFSTPVEPLDILQRLQTVSPNCFHFYFQPKTGTAFVGASPERLYRRERQGIKTEALAGTRPRGDTSQKDENLKKELLNSQKEIHEHKVVVEQIHSVLAEICTKITVDDKHSLLQLAGGHHLLTRMDGVLRPEVNDARILFVLHPTPAVAGWPTEKVLNIIRSHEPFARGYYAGPFGYVGWDVTEFAVAIRCGLIQKNTLSIYAGAGIVEGSTPEDEWKEIENKMKVFLKAVTP